ncbi:MAG: GNAT family N-acetyltransferase [Acidimicrobiia bacterium]|nr:GNAT family N-acetyltransferase [Acidimicrobiia bacterium]
MELLLVPPGPDRHALLPLLLLADDVAERYIDDGDLWAFGEPGAPVDGIVLTLPAGERGTVDLCNVAVHPERQGRGIGLAMVAAVVDALRAQGWRRAVVGTGTADPVTYVFYQRCGFRPHHVERDVFTRENGYDPEQLREPNSLTHLDVLWFDLILQ